MDPTTDSSLDERSEAERHDKIYAQQLEGDLLLAPEDWEKTENLERPRDPYLASMNILGAVKGLRILDLGCGDGWLSVILAKRGAKVFGCDVSTVGIQTAQKRASVNNVTDSCDFQVASAYQLPYRDQCFDRVTGQAILHHLRHKKTAAQELQRVLKLGGKAVFHEPFGNHIWFERLRLAVPIPPDDEKGGNEWKEQFKYADASAFRPYFAVNIAEYGLFSRLDRMIENPRILRWISSLDELLLEKLPSIRSLARAVVVEMTPHDTEDWE